jgi:hypothetical protein
MLFPPPLESSGGTGRSVHGGNSDAPFTLSPTRQRPSPSWSGDAPGPHMEFTLYYRGELKSNGGPDDKHRLRRHFHCQLRQLWEQKPLNAFKGSLLVSPDPHPLEGNLSVLRHIGGFAFAPLVSERIHLIAELEILLLRPEAPGSIITQGGDIDNRIKTLLDGLKVPSEPNALPKGAVPQSDETPFFCLLEDDNLITRVSVETDRLLEPVDSNSEVVLFIHIKTKQLTVLCGTLGLA